MGIRCLVALGVAFLALASLHAADKDKDKDKDKDDGQVYLDKLVGTWAYVSGERDGKKVPEENLKKGTVVITKETITLKGDDATYEIKYTLNPKKTPCGISMEITKGPQGEGAKAQGIIALKDGELKICYPPEGGDAPKDFSTKEGSKLHSFVLKMKK